MRTTVTGRTNPGRGVAMPAGPCEARAMTDLLHLAEWAEAQQTGSFHRCTRGASLRRADGTWRL